MRGYETAVGDALTIIASVLYVVFTLRGTAKPEVVSWGAWAALLAEATWAEYSTHQYPSARYTGICALACGIVAVLSARSGDWSVTRLDVFSLVSVAIGLVLLLVIRSPIATVGVATFADFAAYLPTMRHAWDEPYEEPWLVYFLFGAGASLTLASAEFTITGVTYPLYLAVADFFVVVIIVSQRRAIRASYVRLFGTPDSWRYSSPDSRV